MVPPITNRVKELSDELAEVPYSKEGAPLEKTVQ